MASGEGANGVQLQPLQPLLLLRQAQTQHTTWAPLDVSFNPITLTAVGNEPPFAVENDRLHEPGHVSDPKGSPSTGSADKSGRGAARAVMEKSLTCMVRAR